MKDYDEMAKSVLKRRDEYVAARNRRMKKTITVLSCFCIAALIGGGIWHFGTLSNHEEATVGDIISDGAYVSDNSSDSANEETQMAAMADPGNGQDGDSSGYSISQDGDLSGYSIATMISSFGETKMDSDISVESGCVLFSEALTGAMTQYGGDVEYRVIVELFSDGKEIDSASEEGKAEMERFYERGYTVAFESYNDGYVDQNYFTIHATLEQLENFPASEQYGYCVMLYGERLETSGWLHDAISETDPTFSATADIPVQNEATLDSE